MSSTPSTLSAVNTGLTPTPAVSADNLDQTPLYYSDSQLSQMLQPQPEILSQDAGSENLQSLFPQLYAQTQNAAAEPAGYAAGGRAKWSGYFRLPNYQHLRHGGPVYNISTDPMAKDVTPMDQNVLTNFIQNDPHMQKMFDVQPSDVIPEPQRKPPVPATRSSRQDDINIEPDGKAKGGLIHLHDILNPQKAPPSLLDHFAAGGAVPTERQKHVGNYKKDHIKLHGMDISIENRAGSERSGKTKDGKEWKVKMPVNYGYIRRTKGADKDHIDVFLGPHHDNKQVHVIDQMHADDPTKFDEHKVMMGFKNVGEAHDAYVNSFADGKGHLRAGAITPMHVDDFRHWAKHGNTKKPILQHFAQGGHVQKRDKVHVPPINAIPKTHYRNDKMIDDGTISTLRSAFRSSMG